MDSHPTKTKMDKKDKLRPDFRTFASFSRCQRLVGAKFWLKKKTIRQVAEEMGLSERFVSYQLKRMRTRLGLERYDYFHKKSMGDLYRTLLRDFKDWERLQEAEVGEEEDE